MISYTSRRKIHIACILLCLALTGIFLYLAGAAYAKEKAGGLVINEVCASNFTLVKDENGQYEDYVELYNPGSEAVSLSGYYLSDEEEWLQKYAMGDEVIPAGGYYVLFLDGSSHPELGQEGFRISDAGERLFLSRGEEVTDAVEIPALSYNTSYGRVNDGETWEVMTASAGSSNEGARVLPVQTLEAPVFSAESGFYEDDFLLTLEGPEGAELYYTLDGSDPGEDAFVYDGPIPVTDISGEENVLSARTDLSPTRTYVPDFPVDKAMVVRAVSKASDGSAVSDVVTKVYFVGYEAREAYEDLAVVSLVTDADNLFDRDTGIYGNGAALEAYRQLVGWDGGVLPDTFEDSEGTTHYLYMATNAFQDGREWEREASLSYFDENHSFCFDQNVGIQIAGQSTRATPKKSFSLYGREIYDETVTLPYEFFPGSGFYSSVKLRNGGNNNDGVMITDAFLGKLAQGRDVATQDTRPCVLFLNGEYWGIYNIRERYKEEYLRNHYGVSEDNVWIIDAGTARVGGEEAQTDYQAMLDMIEQCDLTFDDVYEMVCGYFDVQSLIDYYCINLYVNNTDVSFVTNSALWRTAETEESAYGDSKWRWMLFDLDAAADPEVSDAWLEENGLMQETMIQSLMKNEQFRQQFAITLMDIGNQVYPYERVSRELQTWRQTYRTQIAKSQQRFFDADYTEADFDAAVEKIDRFFRDRFPVVMDELAELFGISGSLEPLTVINSAPEGGRVKVNTGWVETSSFQGQYYSDYPVTLTAEAREGYRFAGWRGDVVSDETQITAALGEGGLRIEAIFEKVAEA